jgi:hypothetical protein
MKNIILISAVFVGCIGSATAMNVSTDDKKVAAKTCEPMAVVQDTKDAKQEKAVLHLETTSPETIYSSLKAYTDAILHGVLDDENDRATWFQALAEQIAHQYTSLASVCNEDGRNALHLAAQKGDDYVATILLVAGIPATSKDNQDATPALLAAQSGHNDVAKLCDPTGAFSIDYAA